MATIPIRRQDMPHPFARLPAEWEPQSGVMLTWPHAHSDWAGVLDEADQTFALIGAAISHRERLLVTAYDHDHQGHILAILRKAQANIHNTRIGIAGSDDVFVRDHGPLTIATPTGPVLLDFAFNGWGGKYPHALDNVLSRSLHDQGLFGTTPMEDVALVLEGGSVESDGEGTLLVTASCLLSPSRNPKLKPEEIEATLKNTFSAQRVLWLHHGYLAGDDTDGHIDTLARFCDRDTIAYCACPHEGDEHYVELKAMETELKGLTTATGKRYRLMPLPWPAAKLDIDGQRMPATYANFLIINGAVLVPTYEDRADAAALVILAQCFPGRAIIPVPCLTLIAQHGSLHCVTMQLPQGVLV
ncbi:MAG TPA: agmatine deiminase family protein [Acidiferrobacter sp.]|nr:agmatine deiminase family protein [Acidiferrobacter sp.]